jgi:hypothetical protein
MGSRRTARRPDRYRRHFSDLFDPDALAWVTWHEANTSRAAIYGLPIGREIDHIHVWKSLLQEAGLSVAEIPRTKNGSRTAQTRGASAKRRFCAASMAGSSPRSLGLRVGTADRRSKEPASGNLGQAGWTQYPITRKFMQGVETKGASKCRRDVF